MVRSRIKVTVICWEGAHNAIGRAYVLADLLQKAYQVELVAPIYSLWGRRIWGPLSQNGARIRTFPGRNFPEYFEQMQRKAGELSGDVLYVVKPRLPGLELGILAKALHKRPLILDIDDYELGFVNDPSAISLEEIQEGPRTLDFYRPYSDLWTRYCANLIEGVDAITVSNGELQKRYGGTIIPHVRDERAFDPSRFDRHQIRRKVGYAADDRVVLFLGTPRPHKGLPEIGEVLERIGNPRYKLCVIGSPPDREARRLLKKLRSDFVQLRHDIAFHELPETLLIADVICALQNPASPISRFQTPAKIVDGLAMGIPVLATKAPPFQELADRGLIETVTQDILRPKLEDMLHNCAYYRQKAMRNRPVFLKEFSYQANYRKIETVIESALGKSRALCHEYSQLLAWHRDEFGPKKHRWAKWWNYFEYHAFAGRHVLREKISTWF